MSKKNGVPNPAPRKRIRLLLGLGAILFVASVLYIRLFLLRPIGSGPAGPAVDLSAFREPWTNQRVHLVGIGDSITAGLGADTLEHSYFNRLVKNPDDEYEDVGNACLSTVLPNFTFENLAVSGTTSQHHSDVVNERMVAQDPNVFGIVVMTSGGNDLIHNYGRSAPKECAMYGAMLEEAEPWIASYKSRLASLLEKITEQFPGGCEIYLADIYDPTDGVGDAPSVYLPDWPDGLAIHAKYNSVISEIVAARESVHLVPRHETFLGHGSHCRQFWRSTYDRSDPYYWYFDNIEDPNDRGYDAIRRVFLNTIIEKSSLPPR